MRRQALSTVSTLPAAGAVLLPHTVIKSAQPGCVQDNVFSFRNPRLVPAPMNPKSQWHCAEYCHSSLPLITLHVRRRWQTEKKGLAIRPQVPFSP